MNSDGQLRVLAFAGSLREKSFNKALLRAATEVSPEGMQLELFDGGEIPLYNADVEAAGDPQSVRVFKDAIAAADGWLISTPDYNRGVAGVSKKAVDQPSQ